MNDQQIIRKIQKSAAIYNDPDAGEEVRDAAKLAIQRLQQLLSPEYWAKQSAPAEIPQPEPDCTRVQNPEPGAEWMGGTVGDLINNVVDRGVRQGVKTLRGMFKL